MGGPGPFARALLALEAPVWESAPGVPPPAPDAVDLWRAAVLNPGAALDDRLRAMPGDAADRAARMGHPLRRAQFVTGQALLAAVSPPSAACSLSHTGQWAAAAVSPDGPLGVDAEQVRPRQAMERLAGRFFSSAEHALVAGCGPEELPVFFYALWTAKEARIKALSRHRAHPAPVSLLSLLETDPAAFTVTGPTLCIPLSEGRMHWCWIAPGVLCACLAPHAAATLRFWEWRPAG